MPPLPAVAPVLPAPPRPRPRHPVLRVARDEVRELRGLLHDVGHGLATLSLLLEVARGEGPTPEPVLDLIDQETARLLGVVHGGSDYTPAPAPVDVNEVVGRVAALADRSRATSVRLRLGAEVLLSTDPTMLGRVVANLVDNAVRAAGPDGHVEIVVRRDVDVVIDVIDDGPGFRRGGPPGVANLGLALVTRLLAACGGRLEVDEARRCGTRMRVVLPDRRPQSGLQPVGRQAPTLGAAGA